MQERAGEDPMAGTTHDELAQKERRKDRALAFRVGSRSFVCKIVLARMDLSSQP